MTEEKKETLIYKLLKLTFALEAREACKAKVKKFEELLNRKRLRIIILEQKLYSTNSEEIKDKYISASENYNIYERRLGRLNERLELIEDALVKYSSYLNKKYWQPAVIEKLKQIILNEDAETIEQAVEKYKNTAHF